MSSPPSSRRIFTYEDALSLFPLVRELTAAAVRQVEAVVNQMHSRDDLESKREEFEGTYQRILDGWAEEIRSLGCEVKGLWLVDWDNGDGYYCWKYPETTLSFFHTYDEGFSGRVPVN